jgi:glutamate formiminotransferase
VSGSALECVANISEGRRRDVVAEIAATAGNCLLDVHSDPWHNRSVLTLAGPVVEDAIRSVAVAAVRLLDIHAQAGVHPRLGVLDVVPFVPLASLARTAAGDSPAATAVELAGAERARDAFARYAGHELGIPCFLYGRERSLPEVRRLAALVLAPDTGPATPHPTAGSSCVGARDMLVAYNLWLDTTAGATLADARRVARQIRTASLRTMAFDVGGRPQVSCNLIDPTVVGPERAFDEVAALAPIERAELVGLIPASVLRRIPKDRWPELDLGEEQTIESRLETAGIA